MPLQVPVLMNCVVDANCVYFYMTEWTLYESEVWSVTGPIYNLNTCEINVPFLKSNFHGLFFTINIFGVKSAAHILFSKPSFVLTSNNILKFIFCAKKKHKWYFIHKSTNL